MITWTAAQAAYVMVAGRHQFFPKRELETMEYSIEETYQGPYQKLRGYIGKAAENDSGEHQRTDSDELTYARYGLWHYVKKEKQKHEPYASLARAGSKPAGLDAHSDVQAIRVERLCFPANDSADLSSDARAILGCALKKAFVPAGEGAQAILYEPDADEEEADLVDALRKVSESLQRSGFRCRNIAEAHRARY